MRTFSSYGQIQPHLHYYAPRKALNEKAYGQLIGDLPEEGGHYITVWAPRQSGKSSIMLRIVERVRQRDDFEVGILTMQSAKDVLTAEAVLELFVSKLQMWFKRDFPVIREWKDLSQLFSKEYFPKPLVLILDEFDALEETFINKFANEFRSMYTERLNDIGTPSGEKSCMLHGLALVGVRSVLGIENVSGSPFNVQRSLHIPNLTREEVDSLFAWYTRESGQPVEQAVLDRLYAETNGQPGLTCWFGELLTEGFEGYQPNPKAAISLRHFEEIYGMALDVLPNNNILNVISKAAQTPYRHVVLELFQTDEKVKFKFDQREMNYLYMNGVIDLERVAEERGAYVKFANPFIHKRLFNYFSHEFFDYVGKLYEPFENLNDTISDESLNIRHLMRRYERHIRSNRGWLLKDAPRRADLRLYEAVYHFNLYMYLSHFLGGFGGRVYPEFPTGNGQIDLIIDYAGHTYGLEVKSFSTRKAYQDALLQAARYGWQLGLTEIALIVFVESIDESNRNRYEAAYKDEETGVIVAPVFVATGA